MLELLLSCKRLKDLIFYLIASYTFYEVFKFIDLLIHRSIYLVDEQVEMDQKSERKKSTAYVRGIKSTCTVNLLKVCVLSSRSKTI